MMNKREKIRGEEYITNCGGHDGIGISQEFGVQMKYNNEITTFRATFILFTYIGIEGGI